MGIALLGSMMLFGCRKIGETAPETASAGTSYVSEETAGESKTETKATEPPAPTEDPAPEPLVPEAIEPTPAEDALPEGMVKSYLTGEPVAEVQGRRRPVAVMLSNIISACPQSGISRAGVIYEAPVEGGITRLMGLFENYDDLEKIGSVRSCREYYVYLAAGFDGASLFAIFRKITIPLLRPTILLTTIMSINGTLQLFDESVNLTGGGPANSTLTMSHYIYKASFEYNPQFGYAAAMSYVIFIMVAILSFVQMKVGDKR